MSPLDVIRRSLSSVYKNSLHCCRKSDNSPEICSLRFACWKISTSFLRTSTFFKSFYPDSIPLSELTNVACDVLFFIPSKSTSIELYCWMLIICIAQSKQSRRGAPWATWPQLALWLVCNAAPWQKVTIFSNNCAIFCTLTVAFCGCDRSFEFTTVFRTYSAQFGTLSAVFIVQC
jgi:hypothetical protein